MRAGIVFDLDDTLVWERDYVRSGFMAVARAVATENLAEPEVFQFLWGQFCAGARGNLFDQLLAKYPALASTREVHDLVAIYRTHKPTVRLVPGAADLLARLRPQVKLALISDGPLASQQAKVAALGLGQFMDPVVLTDVWGQTYWKPHRRPYESVMAALELPAERLIYIGDNPEKDFVTARELGWSTIRFRSPYQLRHEKEAQASAYAPDHEAHSIEQLSRLLDRFIGLPYPAGTQPA